MKKHLILFTITFLSFSRFFASVLPVNQPKVNAIAFTENKGQVHDQYYNSRPEILYGVMAGNMVVHIKRSGVSYQLHRLNSYKEVEDPKTKRKKKQSVQESIYRVDLNWLNPNNNFTKTEDEALPGYSNYYLESCPDGALNVKSYKGVTLHNLYNGINLHYYQKNGELKHDYIVAPHADYKKIQIQIKGATIVVNEDGSLFLSTPFGNVQEGAPIVIQNGKHLKAKWLHKQNTLSFEIQNYNPDYELVIDPVTRLWGTYCGGTGDEQITSISKDANSGSVYTAGYTSTNTSSLIATLGSHQVSYAGGISDAFLAKFDFFGFRLWATYYGGTDIDIAYSCAADASGNVYMTGVTSSTATSSAFATIGSHQTIHGGTSDAFLAKFNGAGIRQWATFYGGLGNEASNSCAVDPSGNVFMSGNTSSGTGTVISTVGSHQPIYGGNTDAFLVKFNSNGVRQWGTYYGGLSYESDYSTTTDANGNVYLMGSTSPNTGSVISTVGSHQVAYGGGLSDMFLVKFDNTGIRQWSTYYGGAGTEFGNSCTTDANNNVYMTGSTDSNTGTAIATFGAHQSIYGGGINGNYDAFLVKFNSNGVRQWGTYYGGIANEYGECCATDAMGNVFLAGITSSSIGNIIATPGSHQAIYGGGNSDAFLAKFDSNGIRQWGTYYGGNGDDNAYACANDALGNVYLGGYASTSTGTSIATTGSYQSFYGGGTSDMFLVKFDACDLAPAQPSVINGALAVCYGVVATYSTPLAYGASSFTWSLPSGLFGSSSSNTLSLTAGSSGVFTLTVGNACGVSPQQTLPITVNPLPTISVSSGSICAGESFTIAVSGANTYSYSGGAVVSPGINSTYTVTGTNNLGCSNTAISTVTVHPLPTVIANSGAICIGQSFTLIASGANSYTYSGGSNTVSPATTTSYTVTGSSTEGCVSNAVISTVTVNANPIVTVFSDRTLICSGESVILTAIGALSYVWSTASSSAGIVVSPSTSTSYTVEGTDANGCKATAMITQSVDACTGINSNYLNQASDIISIYPNPNNGLFYIELSSTASVTVLNSLGAVMLTQNLPADKNLIDMNQFNKGVYFVIINMNGKNRSVKLIKD